MVGIIAVCSVDYLLEVNGVTPWPSVNLARLKAQAGGGCIVRGRSRTKDLSVRRDGHSVEVYKSLRESLNSAAKKAKDIWICGGGDVFREALLTSLVDVIRLTVVSSPPETSRVLEETLRVTYFPFDIMMEHFYSKEGFVPNPTNPKLKHIVYERW